MILQKLKWLLLIPLVVIAFFGFMGIRYSGSPTAAELNDKFIVVNPLDLNQIRGLSKYRSCAGHDYRDPVVTTGKKEASPRSMKHYIKVKEEFAGQDGVVKAIAPFDGKISNIEKRDPERKPDDQQIWLSPNPDSISPRQWNFIFFHLSLRDDLKEGSRVKAGEVIGTAKLKRGPENSTDNFDTAVKFTRPMAAPELDLPLSHATSQVLTEYQKRGVNLEDLVVLETERDQNPCPTTGGSQAGDVYFPADSGYKDYIYFRN